MKLTALKKVHVIFCLTCVYSAHHGWAMEDEDKATNSSGSNSPRTSTPDEAFQMITNEGFLEEDSTKVVTAPPPQKNSTLWDYTLGFVLPKAKKPIPDATKAVSPAIELLKSEPDEAKAVVVDTSSITTDNSIVIALSKPDDLEQGDNDASEENSDNEIERSDAEEDSASDMDEDSVSDTSTHEDLKGKAPELNSAASNSPMPVIAEKGVSEESGEEAEDKKQVIHLEDIPSSVVSSAATTSENDVDRNLATKLVEEYGNASKIEYKQVPSIVEDADAIQPLSTHLTSGQEGEGTHIFNQGHDGSGILGAHFMASLSEKVVSATQALSEGKEHLMQAAIVLWNDPDFWKNLAGDPGDYEGSYAGDYSSPFV